MPPATITVYAEPAVLAADDRLVELLDQFLGVELDPAAPGDVDVRDGSCEITVDDGRVEVFFMEGTMGAGGVHRDAVQARLRRLHIPYRWSHEIYVGDDGYAEEYRYWQPGLDREIVRSGDNAVPADFWDEHQHLDDAALGAALRAVMNFTFDPEPVRA